MGTLAGLGTGEVERDGALFFDVEEQSEHTVSVELTREKAADTMELVVRLDWGQIRWLVRSSSDEESGQSYPEDYSRAYGGENG